MKNKQKGIQLRDVHDVIDIISERWRKCFCQRPDYNYLPSTALFFISERI